MQDLKGKRIALNKGSNVHYLLIKLLEKPTGLDFNILKTSISRMGFGVTPISPEVAKQQQYVADAFYQEKLIPHQINIQAAILNNAQSKE